MAELTVLPPRAASGWAWLLIGGSVAAAVLAVGASTYEAQMFVALSAIIAVLGAILIPHAARRVGGITPRFLGFALAAHVAGSLARYVIIQSVYHGLSDANGYLGAGVHLAPLFRSFQLPPFPQVGTQAMNWASGLLVALIGPTLLGGFVVCSALSFVGSWYFYKAFRVAFPGGDGKLYALLIFLLPSLWYWPSSLGKDALVVLFLGPATYGFALILRSHYVRGLAAAAAGLSGIVMIRPPIAAALAIAAAGAFVLRPNQSRSPQITVLTWIVFVPVLSVLAVATVKTSLSYIRNDDPVAAFEAQQSKDFSGQGGTSNFTGPNPLSPIGLPYAIVTVNFRPFPGEAGGALPTLASLEGVLLLGVLFARRREVWAGLRSWRANGFVILAAVSWVGLSVILSSLTNFGLLARQRTQVLPFLLMLPCMVLRPSRRPSPGPGEVAAVEEGVAAVVPA